MAVKKGKQQGAFTKQVVGLVVILVILICISVIATLIATNKIEVTGEKSKPVEYIADAENLCGQRMNEDRGDTLNMAAVDDRSSFYDKKSGDFKLFYEVEIYRDAGKQSGVNTYYVNCFVSSSSGNISRIEYLEQKDFKPKAIRRTHGNAFGF